MVKKIAYYLLINIVILSNNGVLAADHYNSCGPNSLNFISHIGLLSSVGNRDFNPACQEHDNCYGTIGSTQTSCDYQFAQNLKQACSNAYGNNGTLEFICQNFTTSFYTQTVRNLGHGTYKKAQRLARGESANIFDTLVEHKEIIGIAALAGFLAYNVTH